MEASQASQDPNVRSEFINRRAHHVGAIKIQPDNSPKGIAVPPGGTVFLNATEIRLTAEAPADPADNPFLAPEGSEDPPPLEKVSEGRYAPSDRFLPGVDDQPDQVPPEPTDEEVQAARDQAAAKVKQSTEPGKPVEGAEEAAARQKAGETGAAAPPATPATGTGSRESGEETGTDTSEADDDGDEADETADSTGEGTEPTGDAPTPPAPPAPPAPSAPAKPSAPSAPATPAPPAPPAGKPATGGTSSPSSGSGSSNG